MRVILFIKLDGKFTLILKEEQLQRGKSNDDIYADYMIRIKLTIDP